jgi:hypothetical protein
LLLWKGSLNWDREVFGLDALLDQVDPLHQVAINAPARDAGSRDRGDELGVEREEVRTRLEYRQEHLIAEVYAAFAHLTGLPESSSRAIEDLDDLARIESALSAIDALAALQARLGRSTQHSSLVRERRRRRARH